MDGWEYFFVSNLIFCLFVVERLNEVFYTYKSISVLLYR